MYSAFILILSVLPLLSTLAEAHTLRSSSNFPPQRSLNVTTARLPVTEPFNSTLNPLNFLGVQCYHIQPATVTLNDCQSLFAMLVREGNVYEEKEFQSRSRFRYPRTHCSVMIFSPYREDKRVKLSVMGLIKYATEILEECRDGGANTFQGSWQVVVTRDYYKPDMPRGEVNEE